MKPIILDLNNNSSNSLYIQLYNNIKSGIISGEIKAEEKLPSLRAMSLSLGVSITTVQLAYNQLLVEGYIDSKPQSGYYVSKGFYASSETSSNAREVPVHASFGSEDALPYIHDDCCFDFSKWKKCSSTVFNEYYDRLLYESDPQGEKALRIEISRYLYSSRGVTCSPGQIVIGAGTQQITGQLCRILSKIDVTHVSLESPGYLPVQNMFRDSGFTVSRIPVLKDGIDISKLPANIPSAVYVSPSNQFPTGAVMPAGRRYQLLDWAKRNKSIIIEDDYDSELRYFGKRSISRLLFINSLSGHKNIIHGSSRFSGENLRADKGSLFSNLFQGRAADPGYFHGKGLLPHRHPQAEKAIFPKIASRSQRRFTLRKRKSRRS